MGRAKEILVKVIPAKVANEFVKKHHYSGKVVPNSTLHFGCFLDDKLHGVLSFGGSTDKRKTKPIVDEQLPVVVKKEKVSFVKKLLRFFGW